MLADSRRYTCLGVPGMAQAEGAKSRHNPVEEAVRAIQDREDECLRV